MTIIISNALAAMAVTDIAASSQWYRKLLGRDASARPMDGLEEWQFPSGGWIQLYEKAEHAGHGAVTLVVPDIDACREWLDAQGYSGIKSMDSETASIAILLDPDANQVVFAQSRNPAKNPSTV